MIRKIEERDMDVLVALIRRSFLTVAEEFGITEENAPRYTAFATTRERLEYQFREGRKMYAYVDEQDIPIGYYSLCPKEEGMCELNNLCVAPERRHEGIGEALMHHAFAEALAAGYGRMHIGIVEENQRLKRWYESYGFVHVGAHKYDFFPFTSGYMIREL